MSRYLKLSAWALATLTALALLATVTAWWLLATEPGSRWLMARSTALAAPQLRYRAVSGTLANGLSLRDIEYPLPGESSPGQLNITALDGRWNLWNLLGGQLIIDQLQVRDISLRLPEGNEQASGPPAPWPNLALPLPVLLQNLEIDQLRIIRGEQTSVIDRVALAASANPLRIRVRHLEVVEGENRLTLAGRIANRRPYTTDLKLQWQYRVPGENPYSGLYTGEAEIAGNLDKLVIDHQLAAPYTLTSKATLQLAAGKDMANLPDKLRFSLDSTWPDIPVYTGDQPPLTSTGNLQLSGTPAAVDVALSTRLQGSTADGDPLPLGLLTATGTMEPRDGVHWDARLAVEGFPLGAATTEVEGHLNARLATTGLWRDNDYQVQLELQELTGELEGEPVSGTGSARLSPGDYRVNDLQLTIARNRLQLDARLDVSLHADWQLQLPDLQQLYPALDGAVNGSGTVRGDIGAPRVDARLTATALAYGDLRIGSLQLEADSDASRRVDIKLAGNGIDLPGWRQGSLQLTANGTLDRHRLTLTASNPDTRLDLEAGGGYAQPRWQGRIEALTLAHPLAGQWRLDQPATLAAGALAIELGQACLEREDATLCTHASHTDGELSLAVDASHLDLAWLAPWLPPDLVVSGYADGGARIGGNLKQPTGTVSLAIDNGTLRLAPAASPGQDEGNSEDPGSPFTSYPFTLNASGTLTDDHLDTSLALAIEPGGHFDARVAVPTAGMQEPLSGTVTGRFSTLAWLDGFLPALEQLDGRARLDLTLGGTMAAPEVRGELGLEHIGLQIPAAGLNLVDGSGTLSFDGLDRISVRAGIHSGEGQLAANGNLDLSRPALATGALQLTGSKFTLVDLPDMTIAVNPDIAVTLNPDHIAITGELAVDSGHVQLQAAATDAVQVSPDERIVPADQSEDTPGRPVNTSVRLRLGDDFRFEGYGLTSRLTGSLRLTQDSGEPPRGVGNIRVRDGRFTAYGQKLSIDNGVLIFQGPLDNPGLSIRAERETRHATVGLMIGGTAKNITSELFSNPALSETDTLAVLVTGKPLSEASESDANLMASAATSLGIANSGWITGKLQNTFGLDTLKLQGGESYEESALVVGKYLTPDLFVSYVRSLFTPEGTVQLDYTLTRNIGVKATSGEKQTVDILYKIEH